MRRQPPQEPWRQRNKRHGADPLRPPVPGAVPGRTKAFRVTQGSAQTHSIRPSNGPHHQYAPGGGQRGQKHEPAGEAGRVSARIPGPCPRPGAARRWRSDRRGSISSSAPRGARSGGRNRPSTDWRTPIAAPDASARRHPTSATEPTESTTPVKRCRIERAMVYCQRYTDRCGESGRLAAEDIYEFKRSMVETVSNCSPHHAARNPGSEGVPPSTITRAGTPRGTCPCSRGGG